MTDWRARRKAYERRVVELVGLIDDRRERGEDWETVARALVEERNRLKLDIRMSDDPADVALLEQRGRRLYGHSVGPDPDTLFAKYGDWELVARAACRPQPLSGLPRKAILQILRSEQ